MHDIELGSVRVLENYGNRKSRFPGLDCFGKERIFEMAVEKFWIFGFVKL